MSLKWTEGMTDSWTRVDLFMKPEMMMEIVGVSMVSSDQVMVSLTSI